MCVRKQPWPLIVVCALLCPVVLFSGTHSSPIAAARGRSEPNPCAHDSITELIRKSPVILKALGAHIFTDDTPHMQTLFAAARAESGRWSDGRRAVNGDLKWQNVENNNFFASATLQPAAGATTTSNVAHNQQQSDYKQQQQQEPLSAATLDTPNSKATTFKATRTTSAATNSDRMLDESILITLTPETIYKGASLLKMTPGTDNAAHGIDLGQHSGGTFGSGGVGSATSESAYQYEGQLNATLQHLSCFDGNLLKMLPTELIVFGKLVNAQKQQQQQLHNEQQLDFLSISINGLHRWTPQFENHIWKHLGWDGWSDFTLCSVTCGKGVQQRFRRCLLDNPMVNFNMQLNLNTATDDDDNENDDDDDEDVVDGNMLNSAEIEDNIVTRFDAFSMDTDDDALLQNKKEQLPNQLHRHKISERSQPYNGHVATMNSPAIAATTFADDAMNADASLNGYMDMDMDAMQTRAKPIKKIDDKFGATKRVNNQVSQTAGRKFHGNKELMRTFHGNKRANEDAFFRRNNVPNMLDKTSPNVEGIKLQLSSKSTRSHKKRRKPAKNYSTMFCEGYNIEQRNCNTFECNDDISDLLKFYKKYPTSEDGAMQSSPVMPLAVDGHTITTFTVEKAAAGMGVTASTPTASAMTVGVAANAATMGATSATQHNNNNQNSKNNSNTNHNSANSDFGTDSASGSGSAFGVSFIFDSGGASAVGSSFNIGEASAIGERIAATVANSPPFPATTTSTTPANMGYVRSWRNSLNFTIMLTLRVRNDSETATTIFSIRNATHNLYLESCKDGLRLYLERDSTTEMLPVKFNLYDYRWHQVAISIQNGDFISIYVDCSWTNSFVVSKRLYTLPLDADVEIGRGFNGELQQLLVLPDNQERQQCSNKRTSINEVKRYIIDTFIDDYSN